MTCMYVCDMCIWRRRCSRTYSSPSCHLIPPSHLIPSPHTSIHSLHIVHCTAQIAVMTQTCTEDGAGCERDDLHPITPSPSHPPHPLTSFITYHSPPYPSTSTPHPPTPLLTLPPYHYSLTLSSLSPSPHSLFSILAAILHLSNIQFFKVSTEVASTARCELVTGCPSLSNSPLHVLVAPVCTGDPGLRIYSSPSVFIP